MESDDKHAGLYVTHRAALISYATSLLGSKDEAEEIVQEAFSKLVLDNSAEIETPGAYLRRIVRNLALNKRRRRKYELAQATEHAPEWIQPLKIATPEQDAVFNEQVRIIADALGEFPHRTRVIIEMHRFDGHTLQEISSRLDLPITTVHRILTTAMAQLTKRLSARLT